jgi:hypothetical protein
MNRGCVDSASDSASFGIAELLRNLSPSGHVALDMMMATLFLLAINAAAVPSSGMLPVVTTQTLAGERVVLLSDLRQPAVFVVCFTKASRAETEPWAERLRADPRVSTKVRIYEVSILDGVPGFLRAMIPSQ